ncbi:ABC transporter substrate-binding protein [Vannielia litorea]|uniref:ABC transporter substrate-binding protein n=1 Tax=Vannielia TaxID=2813041 RepID=UPI001C96E961|nr:extracellular solute-binding protein [Vannielia litorea]MBY6048444.1 extracellular solute-binding protein [Vannielia litorea]MBY6075858.1 extracellular solute-binding protein [Vannielia litorea]
MTLKMDRRGFGRLMGGGASLWALASTGALAQANGSVRLIWWGNPERDKRTNAVVELYEGGGMGEVVPETYAWGDYWQKLATQAAGNSLPDVLQMDYRYIFEWARRGQLEPLDGYFGNEIDVSDYDENQLKGGMVDGKTYGISLGANSMTHVYNKAVLSNIGYELPDSTTWTTEDFVNIGKELKDQLPDGMAFSENMGSQEPRLQTWVRSRGKDLYTSEGELGFDVQDVIDYFVYWKMMQDEGLTQPADVQAQDSGKMEERMHVNGKSLFGFIHSNQLVGNQQLMTDEVDIVMIPNAGDSPGHYMKPSMFFSMSANAGDKAAAAKFISFFVSDEGANDILLIERGVTADASIRERITPGLTETEQKIIRFLNMVDTRVGALPPPPPANAGEIDRALRPAWESVAFGQVTPEEGATAWYDDAARILKR